MLLYSLFPFFLSPFSFLSFYPSSLLPSLIFPYFLPSFPLLNFLFPCLPFHSFIYSSYPSSLHPFLSMPSFSLCVFISHTQNQRYSTLWAESPETLSDLNALHAFSILALGERVAPVCSCRRCGCVAGSQENWVPPVVEYSRTWDIFGMLFKDLLCFLVREHLCV